MRSGFYKANSLLTKRGVRHLADLPTELERVINSTDLSQQ